MHATERDRADVAAAALSARAWPASTSVRVVAIVDNYAHLSVNVGPTLMSWLERFQPAVYDRIRAAHAQAGAGIALPASDPHAGAAAVAGFLGDSAACRAARAATA